MRRKTLIRFSTCFRDGSSNLSLSPPLPIVTSWTGRKWHPVTARSDCTSQRWPRLRAWAAPGPVGTRPPSCSWASGAAGAPPHPGSVWEKGNHLPRPIPCPPAPRTHPLSHAALKGWPWSPNTLTAFPGAEAEVSFERSGCFLEGRLGG